MFTSVASMLRRAEEENKPDILQYRLEVSMNEKVDAMEKLLQGEELERVMVFCNTKGNAERASYLLRMRGVDAQCSREDREEEILLTIHIPRRAQEHVSRETKQLTTDAN